MNFVIGKIGRSVLFDPNKWGATGGDNEPSLIFLALAKHHPEHTFYMISRSDIAKNRKRIPSNILDAWEGCKEKDVSERYDYPLRMLAPVGIDGGIIFGGLSSTFNIPLKVKPLSMFVNYTAPLYYYLNATRIPWLMLAPDPRYVKNGQDLFNPPVFCFSQYNYQHKHNHYEGYNFLKLVESTFDVKYCGLEKTYFIGQKPANKGANKTEDFNVILNQGGNGGLDRGPELLKYIGDTECSIYGKWDEIYYEADSRFKGPVNFRELRPKLMKTKYTFIIPTDKGWVTSKYWEMLHMGVIPFMHQYYDQQNHLPAGNFLRVKSPEELWSKIAYLNENDDRRLDLISKLQFDIDYEDYDGSRLANNIMSTMRSCYGRYNPSSWQRNKIRLIYR